MVRTPRRLLTADEVRRLRQDELLLVSGNRKPVRTQRWCWQRPPVPALAGMLGAARVQPVALPVAAMTAATRQSGSSLRDRLRMLDDEDDDD